MIDGLWTLTVTAVSVALIVLLMVVLVLGVTCVRLVLADRVGLHRRSTAPAPADPFGYVVEDFAVGFVTSSGSSTHHLHTTWPQAAAWAAETSRRPDVHETWVDVRSSLGHNITSWLWRHGLQTDRTTVAV